MNTTRLLPTLRAFRPLRPIRTFTSTSRTLVAPDPWPLPLSPDTVSREQYAPQRLSDDPESWDMPQPIDRKGEDAETMRARLVYQTRKRGCLEGDLLLSTFAKERLGSMSVEQMREFDKILDEPDWDIFYWSVEKKEPPARWKGSAILEELKLHAKNEGKVVRMMPSLPDVKK